MSAVDELLAFVRAVLAAEATRRERAGRPQPERIIRTDQYGRE